MNEEKSNVIDFMSRGASSGQDTNATLPPAGRGGTYDGMDGWQTSVENRLQSIDARLLTVDSKIDSKVDGLRTTMDGQFKLTWTGLILGFLITWGGLIAGFLWIAERLPA